MLHGNPTWSFYYRHLIDSLRGSYRVIVPDHIGCGMSDKPDDSRYHYTLASRVDDLELLLDHLGLDRDITLILHDWGGMIGMAYAARHPERIARLVVSNTAAFHKPAGKPLPRALAICRDSRPGRVTGPRDERLLPGDRVDRLQTAADDSRAAQAYVAPYDSWNNRIAMLRFVQDIPLHPGDRELRACLVGARPTTLAANGADAHSLGHERLRLRPPFPGRMVALFSRGARAPISRGGPLSLRGRSGRDQRSGAGLSRGPPRHLGARRLTQTFAPVERSNIAIHLSRMAMRQPHAMAVVVPDGRDRGGRVRYTHLTYAAARTRQQSDRARLRRRSGSGAARGPW